MANRFYKKPHSFTFLLFFITNQILTTEMSRAPKSGITTKLSTTTLFPNNTTTTRKISVSITATTTQLSCPYGQTSDGVSCIRK